MHRSCDQHRRADRRGSYRNVTFDRASFLNASVALWKTVSASPIIRLKVAFPFPGAANQLQEWQQKKGTD